MANLFWQVYKNLERDFLSIAEVVHINDKQLTVFSMKIADLLVRTVIEIESLSKQLYLMNDGKKTDPKSIYFDTDAIAHLDSLWKIEKKVVMVVCPDLYLEKEENMILRPLEKASNRSGADWNKAYQAVKHDRNNQLKKGRIDYLLHGLAALYLLNLYYKDVRIENVDEATACSTDCSFGSSLFAVKMHKISGFQTDVPYPKQPDFEECTYLVEYEEKSKEAGLKAIDDMNSKFTNAIVEIAVEQMNNEIKEGQDIEFNKEVFLERIAKVKKDPAYISMAAKKMPRGILAPLASMRYNVVLNRNQY